MEGRAAHTFFVFVYISFEACDTYATDAIRLCSHSLPLKVCRLWELFALRAHDSIVAFSYTVIGFMCLVCAVASESGAAYILQSHTHRTFCP